MMRNSLQLFIFAFTICVVNGLQLLPSATSFDRSQHLKLFESFDNGFEKNLTRLYYAVGGIDAVGNIKKFSHADKACRLFGGVFDEDLSEKQIDDVFYGLHGSHLLLAVHEKCKIEKFGEISKFVDAQLIRSDLKNSEIYYLASISHIMKNQDLKNKLLNLVEELFKRKTMGTNFGWLIKALSLLDVKENRFQAYQTFMLDELNLLKRANNYAFFEQGLFYTALTVDGIISLSDIIKKPLLMNDEHWLLLANYFLRTIKFARNPADAWAVTKVLRSMSSNQHVVAVSFSFDNTLGVGVSLNKREELPLFVNSPWGEPLKLEVEVSQVILEGSTKNLLDKPILLTYRSNKQDYLSDLFTKMPSLNKRGTYLLTFNARAPTLKPKDSDKAGQQRKYIGITNVQLSLKVTAPILLNGLSVSVLHKEQMEAFYTENLKQVGDSLSSNFPSLDARHVLSIVVSVDQGTWNDISSTEPFHPQQVFLRFVRNDAAARQDVVMVGQAIPKPSTSSSTTSDVLQVKLVVSIDKNANEFGHISGLYDAQVIVGDSLADEVVQWNIGKLQLDFPPSPVQSPFRGSPDVHWHDSPHLQGDNLPEIEHMFRPPEKRASSFVVMIFTALTVGSIAFMFLGWMLIGVNLKGLQESTFSSIAFHVCLCCIFGIYFCYWTRLNMFMTLKYLLFVCFPTFFAGNRMLANFAAWRIKQTKSSAKR